MKKSILTSLLISPLICFGQAYPDSGSGLGGIIGLIVGLGICLAIFLVLRQFVLWYWKVETIIANQQEQTKALQAIYNSIEEQNRLLKQNIETKNKTTNY